MGLLKISGNKIDGRSLPTYIWNADLVAFDGPLISLYKKNDYSDALFVWIDASKLKNRWAILDITRDELRDYLTQNISLLHIFKSSARIFVFDTTSARRKSAIMETTWEGFPNEYLPKEDSFLADEISTLEAKQLAQTETQEYTIKLDGELYLDDLSKIPQKYLQLYSFHYGLEHLDRAAVQNALARLMNKWKGGINAVNLFFGLRSVTPSIHRAKLSNLQYASPGHIKMELLPEIASQIQVTTECALANFEELEELYKDVYRFFRSNKLSGFEDERAGKEIKLNKKQDEELKEYISQFFDLLDWNSYQEKFSKVEMSTLAEARAILAYYRRLRSIIGFTEKGLIRLT